MIFCTGVSSRYYVLVGNQTTCATQQLTIDENTNNLSIMYIYIYIYLYINGSVHKLLCDSKLFYSLKWFRSKCGVYTHQKPFQRQQKAHHKKNSSPEVMTFIYAMWPTRLAISSVISQMLWPLATTNCIKLWPRIASLWPHKYSDLWPQRTVEPDGNKWPIYDFNLVTKWAIQ